MDKQNKKLEENVTTSMQKQKQFDAIISNMTEGLIVIDNNGYVLSINESAVHLCSGDDKFKTGESIYVLNRDLDFYTTIEKTLRGKSCEYKQNINGKICKFFMSPVETSNDINGAVIIIMDTTETENREELRREFTANVSHELKTPLTSISGYAEIIKTGIAKDKDIRGFAEKIYFEAQRLIALVIDIIKLSRLDENEGFIQKERCDLYSIANTVVGNLESVASQKEIKINLKGESSPVIGVSIMLQEMIFNLCDNAIKYNNKGGKVDITVRKIGDKCEFCICDNGIGIPKNSQDRIFERFYRVDKSHSKETGGTGLGLSIVKHCLKLHGGTVDVQSEVGKGTKITIIM